MLHEIITNVVFLMFGAGASFALLQRIRWHHDGTRANLILGLVFGAVSVLVVSFPINVVEGATFDTRAGPVILSGLFGGPVAAFVTSLMAATARLWVGGPAAVGGAFGMVLYGIFGVVAGWAWRRYFGWPPNILGLLLLGALSVIAILPAFFVGMDFRTGLTILSNAWYLLFAGNVFGVLVCGYTYLKLQNYMESSESVEVALASKDLACNSARIGIWQYNFVTDKLLWDPLMYELYDQEPESFGESFDAWREHVFDEDLPEAEAALQGAEQADRAFSARFRVRIKQPPGYRWLQAYALFTRDKNGKAIEAIGVNWDITSEVEFERHQARQLDMAEASNNAKTQFLASVSHELRTPLNAIMGYAQILQMDVETEREKSNVSEIIRAAEALTRQVDSILFFGKMNNRAQSNRVELDLNEFLQDLVLRQEHQLAHRKIAIDVDCAPNLRIEICKNDLLLVLDNLISNAIKYNVENGQIKLTAARTSPHEIVIEVRDTGVGIREDMGDRIYEPFERAGHQNSVIQGTGLGLAIAQDAARRLNGEITYDSKLAQGSCFSLTLREVTHCAPVKRIG